MIRVLETYGQLLYSNPRSGGCVSMRNVNYIASGDYQLMPVVGSNCTNIVMVRPPISDLYDHLIWRMLDMVYDIEHKK